MEHLIVQALPSDEIAESSRTTSEVLANFLPNNQKEENLIPLGGQHQKLKKQNLKVSNRLYP